MTCRFFKYHFDEIHFNHEIIISDLIADLSICSMMHNKENNLL